MRRGPQPDDLGTEADRAIVAIRCAMRKGNVDGHASGFGSKFCSTRKP
jgi:hypothetical protein